MTLNAEERSSVSCDSDYMKAISVHRVKALADLMTLEKSCKQDTRYFNNNNDNNTNDTYIAQILKCIKCANAYQHQTEMFSLFLNVSSKMSTPQIIWQAVPHSWSTDREAALTVTGSVCGITSWHVLASDVSALIYCNATF